jgi:hypothetical protein
MTNKGRVNPFYVVLVVVGVAFCVTACAYGVMAFRAVKSGSTTVAVEPEPGLVEFLDRHGVLLMGGELALLALATAAAIGTDSLWSRRPSRPLPTAADPAKSADTA